MPPRTWHAARGTRPLDQLWLALKWNRPDVAAEKIFTSDATFADNELEDVMSEALITNKVRAPARPPQLNKTFA